MATTKPALYALLIGINEYHPDSGVTSLDGCVNDVKAVEKFLKKHYKDLLQPRAIKKLLNEKATRKNIIQAFQRQLIKKAQPGDTVLLYYAGHGSFNESLDVFKQFDGKDQDETFVCYDSRLPGQYDLADKEIAVLLSRINQEVDTVVIADSCHSGSITRNVLRPPLKTRFFKGRSGERALEHYLLKKDDFYGDILKRTGKITIPTARHLLLSGCERGQESLETFDKRGLFTTTLLKKLAENQDISYSHLFESVRGEVLTDSDQEQQPTLTAWESFNPNTVFLRKSTQPNTRHLVNFEDGKWQLEYGAIYGLPAHPDKAAGISIGIYDSQHPTAKFVTQVKVDKVNLGTTWLEVASSLDKTKQYWGEIQNTPVALRVNLEGTAESIATFNQWFQTHSSIFFRLEQNTTSNKYTLSLSANKMTILLTDNKQVINKVADFSEKNLLLIRENLEHIAKWETVSNLTNEYTTDLKDALEVVFHKENKQRKWEPLKGNHFTFNYGDDETKTNPQPIWYQLKARNVSAEPLFVALLHLSADFGINAHFQSQILEGQSDWEILDTEERGLIITNPKASQSTDVFKIIISNKQFDERKFLLPKLKRNRGGITRAQFIENLSKEAKEKWFAHTITVNLLRYENKISKAGVSLFDDQISIKGHEALKADIVIGTSDKINTRSLMPWGGLQHILAKHEGATLVNFGGGKRSLVNSNVIELSNLQGDQVLKDKPLELTVHQSLANGETIIPVTFDGEFIIPIGTSEQLADGSVNVRIDQLPTGKAKGRSLARSAWFSLLKLARFEDSSYFKLRKVYYKKGVPKRTRLRKSHIRNADKILLVIHGIIGDTKGMIKNLEFLEDTKKYDLILTFDYENLNTKIEDIAAALNERLEDIGLNVNDGKTFDILAHSMGGLVSRYMIEYVRKGDSLVDNLFMFGTPNGGSVFGDIPVFRDRLTAILTIGLNYGKLWLGTIGIALDYFNKFLIGTRPLTVTLAQMSTEGDFIDKLVNSEVAIQTKYTIVAGDITDYQSLDDAFFTKLMDTILVKIGNTANDEANDIAVMVEDIRAVPEAFGALKYDACCHHMNYFDEGEGLRILKEIMG